MSMASLAALRALWPSAATAGDVRHDAQDYSIDTSRPVQQSTVHGRATLVSQSLKSAISAAITESGSGSANRENEVQLSGDWEVRLAYCRKVLEVLVKVGEDMVAHDAREVARSSGPVPPTAVGLDGAQRFPAVEHLQKRLGLLGLSSATGNQEHSSQSIPSLAEADTETQVSVQESFGLLSLGDQNIVKGLLEAVFAWAIVAMLPVNVRACFENRVVGGHKARLSSVASFPVELAIPESIERSQRVHQREVVKQELRAFTKSVLDVRKAHHDLAAILDHRHLPPLFTAILCSFPPEAAEASTVEIRQTCAPYVWGEALFVLMNLPIQVPSSADDGRDGLWRIDPARFRAALSRQLTELLCRRDASRGFRTMCDLLVPDSRSSPGELEISTDTFASAARLSLVVSSPPEQVAKREYLLNVCSQLAEVIQTDTHLSSQKFAMPTPILKHCMSAVFCVSVVLARHPAERLGELIWQGVSDTFAGFVRKTDANSSQDADAFMEGHLVLWSHLLVLSDEKCPLAGFKPDYIIGELLDRMRDAGKLQRADVLQQYLALLFSWAAQAQRRLDSFQEGGIRAARSRAKDEDIISVIIRVFRIAYSVAHASERFLFLRRYLDEHLGLVLCGKEDVFPADVVDNLSSEELFKTDEDELTIVRARMTILRSIVADDKSTSANLSLDNTLAVLFLSALQTFVTPPVMDDYGARRRMCAVLFLADLFAQMAPPSSNGEPEIAPKRGSLMRRMFDACSVVEFLSLCNVLLEDVNRELVQNPDEDPSETVDLFVRMMSFFLQTDSLRGKMHAENLFIAKSTVLHCESLVEMLTARPSDKCATGLVSRVAEVHTQLLATVFSVEQSGGQPSDHDLESGTHSSSYDAESLPQILDDLRHPLLPVRAHALVALRKYVLSMLPNREQTRATRAVISPARLVDPGAVDPFVKSRASLEQIGGIFKAQLLDDDSYVFLAAIEGLSAVVDVDSGHFLPILLETFSLSSATAGLENRLKVGEVLNHVIRRFGQSVARHASIIIDCLLRVCHEPFAHACVSAEVERDIDTSLIRASALSNIGQICKQLGAAVQEYAADILRMLLVLFDETAPRPLGPRAVKLCAPSAEQDMAKDPQQAGTLLAVEVRRGCCYVCYDIFRGLSTMTNSGPFLVQRFFPQNPDAVTCLDVLQRIVDNTSGMEDEVVVHHAAFAVGALGEAAELSLSPLIQEVS